MVISLLGPGGMSLIQYAIASVFLLTAKTSDVSQATVSSVRVSSIDAPAIVEEKSSVEFEVQAEFPNPCYQFGPSSVRVDHDRNVIFFHLAASQSQQNCESHTTLLTQKVKVGRLREGEYEIRELKSLKKWGKIQVAHFELSASTGNAPLELASPTR